MLQKFREENYLNDKNYLDYINYIKITYDESNEEFKELPFCFLKESFLNPDKKFRLEQIVVFASEVQMKKLEKKWANIYGCNFQELP